jgi:hypothetical protein
MGGKEWKVQTWAADEQGRIPLFGYGSAIDGSRHLLNTALQRGGARRRIGRTASAFFWRLKTVGTV